MRIIVSYTSTSTPGEVSFHLRYVLHTITSPSVPQIPLLFCTAQRHSDPTVGQHNYDSGVFNQVLHTDCRSQRLSMRVGCVRVASRLTVPCSPSIYFPKNFTLLYIDVVHPLSTSPFSSYPSSSSAPVRFFPTSYSLWLFFVNPPRQVLRNFATLRCACIMPLFFAAFRCGAATASTSSSSPSHLSPCTVSPSVKASRSTSSSI